MDDQGPAESVKPIYSTLLLEDPDLEPLVEDYLQSLPQLVVQLDQALARSDLAELAELAHRIKGTGGSYGFDLVTEMGLTMEAAAKAGEHQLLQELLARFADLTRCLKPGFGPV